MRLDYNRLAQLFPSLAAREQRSVSLRVINLRNLIHQLATCRISTLLISCAEAMDAPMNNLRTRSSLLDLPAELRLMIYPLCFDHEEPSLPRWPHGHPPRGIPLLRTCRLIYADARPFFYEQTAIVLHEKHMNNFPASINEHIQGTRTRNSLCELVIVEPRVIPYRFQQFPPTNGRPRWNFKILNHLPAVKVVTITDVAPIPIILRRDDVTCSKAMCALEHYIAYRLQTSLAVFNQRSLKNHKHVRILASARIAVTRGDGTDHEVCRALTFHVRGPIDRDIPRATANGNLAEVVATTQLNPDGESFTIDADRMIIARTIVARHIAMHSHAGAVGVFPIRVL